MKEGTEVTFSLPFHCCANCTSRQMCHLLSSDGLLFFSPFFSPAGYKKKLSPKTKTETETKTNSPLSSVLRWPFHCLWLVALGTKLVTIYLTWLNALFLHPIKPGSELTKEDCILVQKPMGTFLSSFFSFILFKCAAHLWVILAALWAC